VETLTYGAFSEQLHGSLKGRDIPIDVSIEITRRCPLVCAHCYNNLPMADRRAQLEELTAAEHFSILDQLAEMGSLWLLYTGGEIFARPDFLDIYTHAKRQGFLVTLFTNGTLISPRVADYLAEWRPFSIEITLYGRTRETYERLTGVAGSFDRCMRGIELLRDRGLPLKLKTVAVTINKHEVWDMQQFAEEELGVEFKFDPMINPRIDCSLSPLAVRLTPEEVVAFDMLDVKRLEEWRQFQARQMRAPESPACSTGGDLYECGGGVRAFAIDPYGKMSICVLSQQDKYDLRTGSLREGWDHFLGRVREKKTTRLTKCVACSLKSMCGMCPANGELEHGDPEAPVDFLCQVAHLRAHAFGFDVPPHGDCEYCVAGERHDALMRSVAALKTIEPQAHVESRRTVGTNKLLPMIGAAAPPAGGCGSGGCSSCG
jgi:radical SAM protein with 4Fe4S-binding SPASM domain